MISTREKGTEPSFAPDDLLTIRQVCDLTGHTYGTLLSYSSRRRDPSKKPQGPKPTRLPGASSVLYRWRDVEAFINEGETGIGEGS